MIFLCDSDGRLITLEAVPTHAKVARENIERAGFGKTVEVRLGRASDTLPQLAAEGLGPFDFIFIDANKSGYPEYFEWSLKLAHRGTVIVADNVVRHGAVIDGHGSRRERRARHRRHGAAAAVVGAESTASG